MAKISLCAQRNNCDLLARTVEKSQVNNWNNYWYLVDVDCSQHVWMFGEFVILK
jgi:hypothetical protein